MAAVPGDVSMEGMVEWADSPVPLKNFVDKYGVPNIGKVVKGQYRDVGVAKSVHSELYIHSVQVSQKILAEGVKVKEGRRVVVAGNQKYSLPMTYQGWFELLSQDGKAVKALGTVADLARAFPASVLIRETFKAYVPRETGEISLDRVRVLQAGEQVNLAGEIWVTVSTPKGMVKRCLLHCLDMQGESVYMPMEQKGLFSPIAGQTNISGVHTLRGLLDKFRMPILVRLVHGVIPSKLEKHFTGVFKLNSLYSEESAFVCPMKRDAKMLPISTREPLKLTAASNFDSLKETDECKYHIDRCNKMIASYLNSIHLLFSLPEPDSIIMGQKGDNAMAEKQQQQSPEAIEENILFEEVEDIYAYVREGGPVPPPPRPRPASTQAVSVVQNLPGAKKSLSALKPKNEPGRAIKTSPQVAKNPSPNIPKAERLPPKPVSPIPVSTPSPVPSPTPPPDFQPTKDDYWEEPIYEPLDKIRQMKKAKKVEEKIPAPVVLPQSPARHSPDPAMVMRNRSPTNANSPVQNLRQMYKMTHDSVPANYSIPRPSLKKSDDDIEELREMLDDMEPPPVPPKKYHESERVEKAPDPETESTLSVTTHVTEMTESSFQRPNRRMPAFRSESRDDSVPSPEPAPPLPLKTGSKEKLEQESEKTMAFESESIISDKDDALPASSSPMVSSPASHSSPLVTSATSPTVVNSTIPTTPGGAPVVTVHTPMVARATVPNSYTNGNHKSPIATTAANKASPSSNATIMSNSQPTLVMNTTSPSSHQSQTMSQSHEMLTSAQQPMTYVYTTVPPADYPTSNGYGLNRQNSQKVLLNKPKEPHEKQLLNRRSVANGTPVTAVKINPPKSHVVYSRGGSSHVSNNKSNVLGSYPSNQQAPYVAVARVGETGGGVDMYDTRPSIVRTDTRRKMMHSMYL